MQATFQRLTLATVAVLGLATAAHAAAASMADVNKAAGMTVEPGKHIRFLTTKGTFEVVLFPKVAPKTVENFIALTKKGLYNGTTFHRVIPGFVAQGGDPKSKTLPAGNQEIGTGGSGKDIADEFSPKIKHLTGSLAMAHSQAANSASSQFYVCYKPLPMLDGKYSVFGQVSKGMDVVEKLAPTERDGAPVQNGKPDKMIKVTVF
ncbi:MAG: putative peptidyl-prolyl cis-trans isomerase [Cyanobacteria bacterium RYN_339]|nr:putative peptidyl-prolyl cis-trans isomerase [Cyanobacteria bacterium RYN_339]